MLRGKIYFGIYLSKIKMCSFIDKIYFRIFGARIGKKVVMCNTKICGYVNNLSIGYKCTLGRGCKFIINKEGTVEIGKNTLLSYNVIVVAGTGKITISDNLMIGANTYIINNDHNIRQNLSVRDSNHITKDIIIEKNVWIGANCSILKGVKIGEGSIIGAGSVVTKDIPPYSISVGQPCKVIKNRYSGDELKQKLIDKGYKIDRIDYIIKSMFKEKY